ncbi:MULTISPECIES: HAD-IC family P-type ATPase [unclassified Pseudofrankia]|uniref:cation-translocating P-type ATPase n=1 Tax=unclassified Pseudofrankia TaxID=2994372 RepID=UPI0008DADAFB|nr:MULTISPECIES: HAD-IC family P-type ATPase [unclassified Pseudofrankia]MDT3446691.1 HAD-IC family P-type ATPase [Pseudofrankia sp. BMG5.37]OHV57556.1 hypothetical protein BCD48_42965 [Pseudofrankia sp. BMG5.36]
MGDPTEGALVVLAAKTGADVERLRLAHPRLAEVPFDASYMLMATFHSWPSASGRSATGAGQDGAGQHIRCLVKGAPDAVLARAHRALDADGTAAHLDDEARQRWHLANRDLGAQGLRVMALAYRDLGTQMLGDTDDLLGEVDLLDQVDDLVLVGLVGILDPPRPAAAEALTACRQAGIRVRMVTGDHATTARAIAERLGIDGDVLSGRDLDGMDDTVLAGRMDTLGVVARVSPQHKIRLVRVLQSRGDVVAMTGDGVNDAPALRMADIGVAMGASGTDVARDAATMVLTDDDFATIVTAVREGLAIYRNIVKFGKFQLTTACAFVAIFVVAGIFGVAGGIPFTAVQILWVNVIMDGPPAMSLGLDPPAPDTMRRPPRRAGERILTAHRFARIALLAAVMAVGTIAVITLTPGDRPSFDEATVAGTLAFTTFVLFQVFNLLNLRSGTGSVFSAGTFANRAALVAVVAVVAMQAALVTVPFLRGVFHTVPLGWREWAIAVAVASSVLWAEELRKLIARLRGSRGAARTPLI